MRKKYYILITENGNARQTFQTRAEALKAGGQKKGNKVIVIHSKRC